MYMPIFSKYFIFVAKYAILRGTHPCLRCSNSTANRGEKLISRAFVPREDIGNTRNSRNRLRYALRSE